MSYSPYAYSTATGTTLGLTKIGGNVSAAVDGTITVGTNEVFTLLTATGQVSLAGAAGAESLRVITQASAVNRVEIKGAITSNAPIISANGSDSLINLNFSSKGGTGMTFYGNSGANTLFTAAYTSSAVNWLQLANSATGNAVAVSAQGGDSNVNLNLTAYGTTGIVKVTNSVAASSTITGALQVVGGIGANQIYGATIFDNSNRVITTVTPTAGTGINVSSLTSSGPTASFTINNLGVTSLTGAATIAVSASTGSVTLTNLGPTSVSAGTGISVNQSTGSVIVTNAGVTAFNGSTGAVLGVASITGTSNQVTASASTGAVTLSLPQAIATTSLVTFGSVTANTLTQTGSLIALGSFAGSSGQGTNAIAIGVNAGNSSQGSNSVAIGPSSGFNNQQSNAVAIGNSAGQTTQGQGAVAVGQGAGNTTGGQGANSVAIGSFAGTAQASYAVAIGYNAGAFTQTAGSIILSAGSNFLGTATNAGFYVSPVRSDTTIAATNSLVNYNAVTKEITTSNNIVSLTVGGLLTVNSSLETYTSPSISSNAVTLNYNSGNVFALASNAANITANYTNVPTTTGQVIATSLVITQGATAYIPSAVTINTVSQTIKWQNTAPPTGNANKTDIVSFTFICNGTTTPTVIGSLSTYG